VPVTLKLKTKLTAAFDIIFGSHRIGKMVVNGCAASVNLRVFLGQCENPVEKGPIVPTTLSNPSIVMLRIVQ